MAAQSTRHAPPLLCSETSHDLRRNCIVGGLALFWRFWSISVPSRRTCLEQPFITPQTSVGLFGKILCVQNVPERHANSPQQKEFHYHTPPTAARWPNTQDNHGSRRYPPMPRGTGERNGGGRSERCSSDGNGWRTPANGGSRARRRLKTKSRSS